MEFIIYLSIIFIALIIWGILTERSQKKLLLKRLKDEWGKYPGEDYSQEKMKAIKALYLMEKDDCPNVDDITWNDFDMDEVFKQINNTQCSLGEEYLYALLRKPSFSQEELDERNRLIEYFRTHEKERIMIQAKLYKVGKLNKISAFEYINRLSEQEPQSNLPHYLMDLAILASVILIFKIPSVGVGLTIFTIAWNIFMYFKYNGRIENYIAIIAFQLRLLDSVEDIMKVSIPELDMYLKSLSEDLKIFKKYKRGSSIVVARNVTGNILEMFMDYYRMSFHHDLIKYNRMISYFKKNKEAMNRIFKTVGFLDAMTAAASFRETLDYFSIPELIPEKERLMLSVTDVYHPLIGEPVPNSITEDRCALITGSNASGKSTFIKALGINAILSQTIYTSLSRKYRANYFHIYSSMALKDNILNNESYFIVEIKSLKRILDQADRDYPVLCFIDEVLRGTNTLERIAASSRILASFSAKNAMCFAATHDIELTYILENLYSNYHFRERVEDGQVLFDYKLYKGRAVSRNAIKLLKLMGYSQKIITEAEKAADEYLNTGEWSIIERGETCYLK